MEKHITHALTAETFVPAKLVLDDDASPPDRPQRLTLNSEKPATITKLPQGLASPLFGVLPMGQAEEGGQRARKFHMVLDEPAGKDATLLVDANGNGDLTDDPAVEWKPKPTDVRICNGLKLSTLYAMSSLSGASRMFRSRFQAFPPSVKMTPRMPADSRMMNSASSW